MVSTNNWEVKCKDDIMISDTRVIESFIRVTKSHLAADKTAVFYTVNKSISLSIQNC